MKPNSRHDLMHFVGFGKPDFARLSASMVEPSSGDKACFPETKIHVSCHITSSSQW